MTTMIRHIIRPTTLKGCGHNNLAQGLLTLGRMERWIINANVDGKLLAAMRITLLRAYAESP